MGVRSATVLEQDFPVATTAELIATIGKYDYLIREGFLGDFGDFFSLDPWIGDALQAFAEAFAAPAAVYTGAAGTTSRYYGVVPTYPLEYAVGNAGAAAGKYLNFIGGKPPYGFPPSSASNGVGYAADGVRSLYGLVSPLTTVADTDAALSAANYVTITAPAAKEIAGVTFDIVSSDDAGHYFLVATGVAPGASVNDTGPIATLPQYGNAYTMRKFAEVGYDAATSLVVYAPLSRQLYGQEPDL